MLKNTFYKLVPKVFFGNTATSANKCEPKSFAKRKGVREFSSKDFNAIK